MLLVQPEKTHGMISETAPPLLWQEFNKQSHLKISLCYTSVKGSETESIDDMHSS